jgi:hypothetical protein
MANYANVMTEMMQNAVDDFDCLLANNYDDVCWEGSVAVNTYITKYGELFLSVGQWSRMVLVNFAITDARPHQKISGVLGIISLNVEILKCKINMTRL